MEEITEAFVKIAKLEEQMKILQINVLEMAKAINMLANEVLMHKGEPASEVEPEAEEEDHSDEASPYL